MLEPSRPVASIQRLNGLVMVACHHDNRHEADRLRAEKILRILVDALNKYPPMQAEQAAIAHDLIDRHSL